MSTEAPKQVAVAICLQCKSADPSSSGFVSTARHVNRLDEIPEHFCRKCGTPLSIALYTFAEWVKRA